MRRLHTDTGLLLPGALILATGAGLVYAGLDLPHTAALTVAALLTLVLTRRTDPGNDPEHRPLPDNNRDGARRDLSDLTWAMHGSRGRVSERAHLRVRTLARHVLADCGVDLGSTDPEQVRAAATLLGAKVHQQMTTDTRPPTFKTLRAWVDAVEALTPQGSDALPTDQRDHTAV
jgi:hypothetical protein